MSSKLTELTESSPSVPPPSVLCGSGVLSQFASLSMASSGNLNPPRTYDGYKTVEVIDLACTECLAKGQDCFDHYNPISSKYHYCYITKKPCRQTARQVSILRRYLWSKKYGPFGKEFPVSGAPTPDATSGKRDVARWTNVWGPLPVGGRPIYSSSEVPISRINNEGVVKQMRIIDDSPPNPDAEGCDEPDGEEVEVIPDSAGHPVNSSPSHPPAKRLPSHIIHSTPRNFQPTLSTIPPASPNPYHTRPALNQAVRPSPIPHPRNSPMVTSQQPQPVASTSKRRKQLSPLLFPAAQVLQFQDQQVKIKMLWPGYSGGLTEIVGR
ncbi:hypothetical protein O181_072035 [Austropuccinia psidii MF-1]|uniref:Uncharacterized protein n=1 Tax=Austropuccinia psidii MF-1 TaxID=1389203 RepID=A0A9Q3EZQ0_9BASI|nr:hypothetical protein [Austropuccinia psidii MF-1]